MRTLTSNPFCYTEPVTPTSSQMYNSDPNVPYIVDDLIAHRCCLLVGPPGSGTTSTLFAVRDAFTKKLPEAIWWPIDLAQLPINDTVSLFRSLANNGVLFFPDQAFRWSNKVLDERAFCRVLIRSVVSVRRPVVLAIDHIENTSISAAKTVVRGVRSIYLRGNEWGVPQKFISVVLAGSHMLRRQGQGRGSPLNFARIYFVADLELEVAKQMLLSSGEGKPWRFDTDAAQYLAEVTGGDKYLLQRLGYDCVATLRENGGFAITLDLAQKIAMDFVKAGFRNDPKLGHLLPSLIQDEDALELILDLLGESSVQIPLAQMMRADITPTVSAALKQRGNSVVIRNDLYRRILVEHLPVLEAIHTTQRNAQQRVYRARRLQQLISRIELALPDLEALQSTLAGIRDFVQARDLYLLDYDERLHQFIPVDSTTRDRTDFIVTLSSLDNDKLKRALGDADGRLYCQSHGGLCLVGACIDGEASSCSWIPLKAQNPGRLVGTLVIIGQPLIMPPRWESELMELSVTLADALQHRRHLLGLRQLSRIRSDLPYAEVQREISEAIGSLFNKTGLGLTLDESLFQGEEKILAQSVAKQATMILENSRAYHEMQHRLEGSQLAVSLLPHELKRKPRAIAGELELLLSDKEGPLTSHQVLILKRVQEYLEEHEQLIDTVLDVTRLDTQTYRTTMNIQPILPVLCNMLDRLVKEVEESEMQLMTDLASALPSHRLDPLLVDRVITNLVRNAVQYAGHGAIYVRARAVDGCTLVEVEDEGDGVPVDFRERIFEQWHRGPFSRGLAGRPGNLGLGLYFVRKMMELHDGRAEYDDGYSGGARFILTFPRLEGGYEDDSPRSIDD
ncbi:MAG: Adaptive-response sensory-kinase SasA [Anaerolineae bacterium]|nr:Adaptive-response sensory-kinase SasA [Anaerolineae bacterium]